MEQQITQSNVTLNNTTPFKGEILRKMIHYSSAAIPIGYMYMEKSTVLLIIGAILIFLFAVELLKYKSDAVYNLYMKYFKDLLREHEYDRSKFRINGASWVIFSAIFCIILFPKLIAVTGLLMLSFADSTSALAGRLWGKKQFAPNRSYVGTIVFFTVGLIVMAFAPKYFGTGKEYALCFAALVVTTFADALSLPVDDNFTIPVVCCGTMYLLYIILFPNIILI